MDISIAGPLEAKTLELVMKELSFGSDVFTLTLHTMPQTLSLDQRKREVEG